MFYELKTYFKCHNLLSIVLLCDNYLKVILYYIIYKYKHIECNLIPVDCIIIMK